MAYSLPPCVALSMFADLCVSSHSRSGLYPAMHLLPWTDPANPSHYLFYMYNCDKGEWAAMHPKWAKPKACHP